MTMDMGQVYTALQAMERRQQDSDRSVVALKQQIQEAAGERTRALDTLAQGMGITHPGSLQAVIEESLRLVETRVQEAGHAAELLQEEARHLRAHIAALEAERDQAIAALAVVLELPGSSTRTLSATVAAAVELANEAKRIIQTHP